jgi:hypothetical protein
VFGLVQGLQLFQQIPVQARACTHHSRAVFNVSFAHVVALWTSSCDAVRFGCSGRIIMTAVINVSGRYRDVSDNALESSLRPAPVTPYPFLAIDNGDE